MILVFTGFLALKSGAATTKVSDHPRSEILFAQITGDVRYPGVYSFCSNANSVTLIQRAGGLRSGIAVPEGFKEFSLKSGIRINIRSNGEEVSISEDTMSAHYRITLRIPISLNGESEKGLTAITGIGEALAYAIVREREKRGGFEDLNEIIAIKGIGPNLAEKMKRYLVL